jgi:hypothetical protein
VEKGALGWYSGCASGLHSEGQSDPSQQYRIITFKHRHNSIFNLTPWSRVLLEKSPVAQLLKSPPLAPILSQMNPVRTISSYLSEIHFNIVLPPTSRSPYWSISFWLSHQNPTCIPLLSHSSYMLWSSHAP